MCKETKEKNLNFEKRKMSVNNFSSSSNQLEETLLYLNELNKRSEISKEEGERALNLLLDCDILCQSNDGNMDCILRLWKYYLSLLKKFILISQQITHRLYDSLNTYVSQGLQSLITTNSHGPGPGQQQQQQQQQQLVMKLQLLNFFLQRLCATLIYFGNHFKNENFTQCFLHLYCFQGYVISQQNSVVDGYEAKIRELYQRFFESNFLSTLESNRLLDILTSTAVSLYNNPIRGVCGIGTWIGAIRCMYLDLELFIEGPNFSSSYLTIISFMEIYLRSIECLSIYQR